MTNGNFIVFGTNNQVCPTNSRSLLLSNFYLLFFLHNFNWLVNLNLKNTNIAFYNLIGSQCPSKLFFNDTISIYETVVGVIVCLPCALS